MGRDLKAGAEGGARLEALRQFLLKGGTALVTPLPAGTAGTGRKPDWLAIAPGSLQGSSNGLALTVLDKAGAIFDDVRDARGEVALRNVKVFRYLPLRVESQAAPLLGLEDLAITLAAQKVGQGLLLASGLAFDPAWSTLPLKPAFVALAQGMALNHAGAQGGITSLVAGDRSRVARRLGGSGGPIAGRQPARLERPWPANSPPSRASASMRCAWARKPAGWPCRSWKRKGAASSSPATRWRRWGTLLVPG